MRNSLKWVLPIAFLASGLPAAQAWHHVAYVPGGAPVQGYPVQSIAAYGAQSYPVYGAQSYPVYGAQSYLLQPSAQSYPLLVTGQSTQAQGVGLDIGSLLLNRLLQGGLGNTNSGVSSGSSSDLVNELKANTTALQANTAALKAMTKAFQDDNGASPSNNSGGKLNPIGQLLNPGGVNAESLPVLAQAYAQMLAQANAQKTTTPAPAPAQTSADLLTEAEAQIDLANRSAIQAKRYLDYVEAKGQSETVQLKTLRGQLEKIGVAPTTAPAPTPIPTPTPTPMPEPKKPG